MNPNYEPVTLLEAFEQGPLVHTFLRDTFFGGREYPPTNMIEFDFKRGRRKMAPFIAPLIGGKIIEREGYETRFFRAPRLAPVRNLRVPDLEARMMGETIYSGRTPADRAAELLADDAIYLDETITRREEWMCREILVNGVITVTADNNYVSVISFLESASGAIDNHFAPLNGTWDTANSTPLADFEAARLNTIRVSGVSPNVALLGTAAASAFLNNANVAKFLDKQRFEIASIQPIIQSDAVVRIGRVPGLELYTYAEYFEDDLGQLFPMLPENLVLLASTNVQNKIVYGAFTQLEDAKAKRYVTYQTARIPFVYGDEENGHLFYRLTSCPLPMPHDILAFCLIDAVPPVVGGLSGQDPTRTPYFKPTKEGDEPELAGEHDEPVLTEGSDHVPESEMESKFGKLPGGRVSGSAKKAADEGEDEGNLEDHTVEELRAIADDEGVEVDSRAPKADIIKAIKKGRKNR
jgi:hypothetical protein